MGNLVLAGATSGSTTITPTDAVTATVTLPSTGGTLQTSGAGFTTNGVAYATSTTALATSSALTYSGGILSLNVASAYLNVTVPSGSTTYFGDAVSLVVGAGATDTAIRYDGNNLLFARGSAKKLTLDTTGNLTFNASNAGIIFNNSSALTNSTLNDYETGTWTPTDASGAGLTFSSTSGTNYVKVGRTLMLYGSITFPSTSSGTNAQINIPFTVTGLGGGFTQYTSGGTYGSLVFRNSGGTGGGNTMLVTNGVANANAVTNAQLSGATFQFVFTGPVAF